MKPYRISEENEEFITYEFRSIYLYVLYTIVAFILIGFGTDMPWISYVGMSFMAVYFLIISLPYLPLQRKIRKAMQEGSVEISGSKWSFSKPLKIKMKKDLS